jgi:hypothetical protein
MRKLFWGGAALMAFWAAVYLTSSYACRHPDSWLGRCTGASCRVEAVVAFNPFTTLAQLLAERGQQVGCVEPAPEADDLKLAPWSEEKDQEGKVVGAVEAAEALEPIHVQEAVVPEPAEELGETEEPQLAPADLDATYKPASVYMPPCYDEQAEDHPECMPMAEDGCGEDKGCCPLKAFFHWFMGTSGSPAAEESAPAEDCPACPGEEEVPNCQEDPVYHHQYPSCPYMGGGCPSPGHCPAPAPATGPGHDIPAHPKCPPGCPRPDGDSCVPCPAHHDVDTTECRPSDLERDASRDIPF